MGDQSKASLVSPYARSKYSSVYILSSRDAFATISRDYSASDDLVLTTDYGLKRHIEDTGGEVHYLDAVIGNNELQENNYRVHEFFASWFLDSAGQDAFVYRGIPFGFAFRIYLLSDIVQFARIALSLNTLRSISFNAVLVSSEMAFARSALETQNMRYSVVHCSQEQFPTYAFPINKWLNERLIEPFWKRAVKLAVTCLLVKLQQLILNCKLSKPGKRVFVQEYYPTKTLIQRLKRRRDTTIIKENAGLGDFHSLKSTPLVSPVGPSRVDQKEADDCLTKFREKRSAALVLKSDLDVTKDIYKIIEDIIAPLLPKMIRDLRYVSNYFDTNGLDLVVLIANLGKVAGLVDCYAKSKRIPVYLIANGVFANNFLDESKYATVINAYSESVRTNYYNGFANAKSLGDPRMDQYRHAKAKLINRAEPTVLIGASGYNNLDLNSYLAAEFVFLSRVLTCLNRFTDGGKRGNILLKIRANGYLSQYQHFIHEYFPDLEVSLFQSENFDHVIQKADLYISIASQTILQAGCLGVPVIFYKDDREILNPPWDGNSEVVTVNSGGELEQALEDFATAHPRFDAFQNPAVLERYVGKLDGRNLKRNYRQVVNMLYTGPRAQEGNERRR